MEHKWCTCDVCGNETDQQHTERQIQVVFTTEQTEGRMRPHQLTLERMDICQKCEDIIIGGKCLFGSGAQGHNKYWFKS